MISYQGHTAAVDALVRMLEQEVSKLMITAT
jgi:hypothetical protein